MPPLQAEPNADLDEDRNEHDGLAECGRLRSIFKLGSSFVPYDHQLAAVHITREALKKNRNQPNVLLQHSTGSGKSLTIAALVAALLLDEGGPLFDCILVLNDRLQLDTQIGGSAGAFLEKCGIEEHLVIRPRTVSELRSCLVQVVRSSRRSSAGSKRQRLSKEGVVVFTTLQKMAALAADASSRSIGLAGLLTNGGRVCCVADEAHRSHGGSTTDRLNSLFGGILVGSDASEFSTSQPQGLSYVALTATPSFTALQLFGCKAHNSEAAVVRLAEDSGETTTGETTCSEGGDLWRARHVYSMEAAVAAGLVVNVLDHYTTLTPRLRLGLNGSATSDVGTARLARAAALSPTVLLYKAKFIAKHYLRALRERSLEHEDATIAEGDEIFVPRAMVVCRSRSHVVSYHRLLNAQLRALAQKSIDCSEEGTNDATITEAGHTSVSRRACDINVYAAFSGESSSMDGSCAIGLCEDDEDDPALVSVTESSLNGGLSLSDAHILVVCAKLETGYDDPRLAAM